MTTDTREAFFTAYELAARTVEGIRPEQLDLRTPCAAYDVARLIDHLVGAGDRAARAGRNEELSAAEFPHIELGDAPGELRRAQEEARAAWSDDRLKEETTMPWGETYIGAVIVDMYLAELATHSFDLAAATGQALTDDALAETALEAARTVIRPEYRNVAGEGEPFAAEVEAPPDATAWERLAAFMGRVPRWGGLSDEQLSG